MANVHYVQAGETRASIAARYGVDVSRVVRLQDPDGDNSALRGSSDTLLPGDRVIINTSSVVNDTLPPPQQFSTLSSPTTYSAATTSTTTSDKLKNGGYITFHMLTEQGPAEIPVFISAALFTALKATPVWDKYGLGQAEPQIQVGLSDNFLRETKTFLSSGDYSKLTQATEPLNFFKEVSPTSGDLPALSPDMMAGGIMWARDPISGEMELIDTKPLLGPSLSAYKFTPTDPNNPSAGGTWAVVPDLAMEERSFYEGVPTSVQPWLQAALDAGGDYNVVPEGPARAWVKYLLDQSIRSSSRPPSEMPFGIGLPNFPGGAPGNTLPTAPWTWNPTPTGLKPGQVITVNNPPPAPITQTQQPGYYDVPAAPVQPQSGNPLQEQNGWVLGADGRWRAKNPLTGATPSTEPFKPTTTYVVLPDGTVVELDAETESTSPTVSTPTTPPAAPTPPPPPQQEPTAPKPPASPAPSTPSTPTTPTYNLGPDGNILPNGWSYNPITKEYKGPDPLAKPNPTPTTVQQPAYEPPPPPKTSTSSSSSSSTKTSSSSTSSGSTSSGSTTKVSGGSGKNAWELSDNNEVVYSGGWVMRNGQWVQI